MGCASSAALPFLTTKENQGIVESLNGKPPYELHMAGENGGMGSLRDVNESYLSEKIKGVVDSSAVQGVIGGVVQTKDEIYNQVKGVGDAITEKVNTVVNGVEDTIESTIGKITGTVSKAEEKINSEVKSLEGDVKSLLHGTESDMTVKQDIDELLDALPESTEEVAEMTTETTEVVKTAADEVLEKAVEELSEETEH